MSNKIENSTILITGGAGFIGSYITEQLLVYHPQKIIIIDNLIRGNIKNLDSVINNPIIEFHQADIRNNKVLEELMKGCDFVFHLAALRINACAADPREGFEVMCRSTFEIAELCVKYKIKKVIYSSSASVYGLAEKFPTDEECNPYNNQTFYGSAKLWGEQLFRSYYFSYGLDYVALRYFNVYGPRMDTTGKYTEVMIKWLDCIRNNIKPLIYGDGSTSMDFIYVEDVARANICALLSEKTDTVYNVGCGVETSLKDLLFLMLEINDSSLLPDYRIENTVNPVSRRLANISKIEKELSFRPKIDIKTGISKLCNWYFDLYNT